MLLFRCKNLFSEFSDLPERSTRKRKNQRVTRSGRGRRKQESSDESESDDEEVCFIFPIALSALPLIVSHLDRSPSVPPSPLPFFFVLHAFFSFYLDRTFLKFAKFCRRKLLKEIHYLLLNGQDSEQDSLDEADEEEENEDEEEEIKKPRPPTKKRRKSSKNVSSDED